MNMDNTSLNNQLFPNGGLFYTILSTMTDVFTRELLRKYFEKLSIKISTDDCSVPENQNIVEKETNKIIATTISTRLGDNVCNIKGCVTKLKNLGWKPTLNIKDIVQNIIE